MVYRIPPHRHSPKGVFLRSFLYLLLVYGVGITLVSFLLSYSFMEEREWGLADALVLFSLALVAALVKACMALRTLRQRDWFAPREIFLTLVDEGLLIESPSRGVSTYAPWKTLRINHSGGILQISDEGIMLGAIGTNGMSRERQAALEADLLRYCGRGEASLHEAFEAQHRAFSPEKAAAPFAPKPRAEVPAPAAAAPSPLPPPHIEGVCTRLPSSRTPGQLRFLSRMHFRPSCYYVGLACLVMGFVGFVMPGMLFEGMFLGSLFALAFVAVFFKRILFPGRRLPHTKYRSLVSFSEKEILDVREDGLWARCPAPPVGEMGLLRLDCGWCLVKDGTSPFIMLDRAGNMPPPVLARYPLAEPPANALRGALLISLFLGGLVAGLWNEVALSEEEAQRALAFREMLPQKDDPAALRQFVAAHYAKGSLFGEPQLFPSYDGDAKVQGYSLHFTSSEPCEGDDDGEFHLAWEHWVRLWDDGECLDHESWPALWCPCADWKDGPPSWVLESAPHELMQD